MGFEPWPPALEFKTLPLDHQRYIILMRTKLYFPKSQVQEQTMVVLNGTNSLFVGLYFYFLNFFCGIWS
jgi:hypothetical protein